MAFLNPIARPFGALLMFFYDLLDRIGLASFGLAIVLLAVILKLVLMPFQMKSRKGMLRQSRLQPQIAEINKKHGANKQKVQEETMKLYKEEGVNPASGCFWGLIPMPILIAIFQVIRQPIVIMMGVANDVYNVLHGIPGDISTSVFSYLGAPERIIDPGFHAQMAQSQWINEFGVDNFITRALASDIVRQSQVVADRGIEYFAAQLGNLQYVNYNFLGLDLSINPQWDFIWNADMTLYTSWLAGFGLFLIPLISAGTQFISMRVNRKYQPQPVGAAEGQAKTMQTVTNFLPLMSVWFGFIMPGAFGFYWILSSILQGAQDIWINKVYVKKLDAEEAVRNAERKVKQAELEEKRQETEALKAEGKIEQNKNTSKRKIQKTSKQEQLERAAEWEKKTKPEKAQPAKKDPSRVGDRRFARGRAYDPLRYARMNAAAAAKKDETDDDETFDENELTDVTDDNLNDTPLDESSDDDFYEEYEDDADESDDD